MRNTVGDSLLGRPARRRLSRRRRFRRVVGWVAVGVLVVVGGLPTLRYLGFVAPRLGAREPTNRWEVVSVAGDRRSAVIKVDTCRTKFDLATVTRVGHDVRLSVFVRQEHGIRRVSCAVVDGMPAHVVRFGFALSRDGMILASHCPPEACFDTDP